MPKTRWTIVELCCAALCLSCTNDDAAGQEDETEEGESARDDESETEATGQADSGDGAGSDESEETANTAASAFSLRFSAQAGGAEAGCGTTVEGLGPDGTHTAGISDLRFYVSNLRLFDGAGNDVPFTLDENEFQYSSETGQVSLIDLTSNSGGDCESSAISFAEGTARTNSVITGTTSLEDVEGIAFDVGVPQAVMKETIGTTSAEAAPSPLGEMYWSWATGYRHLVFNFTVTSGDETGDGYLHIGSRDCAAEGELALENREACGFVNTPTVRLEGFDLTTDTVAIDLETALSGLDFVAPIYDPNTFEVIGTGPGVECHSSPMQDDCAQIFSAFGLDVEDGTADAASNTVFRAQ